MNAGKIGGRQLWPAVLVAISPAWIVLAALTASDLLGLWPAIGGAAVVAMLAPLLAVRSARRLARADQSVAQRIVQASRRLADFPGSGRPGRLPYLRELVVLGTPSIIPYTVAGEEVRIIAVFHAARTWPESSARGPWRRPLAQRAS